MLSAGELVLQRYRILGELGRGGMGVVYRCFDEVGGIEVALKALPPELSRSTVEMENVRKNFQLVAKLAHPNIATVRTLERDPGTGDYFLIIEYVEGEDLRQWREKRSAPTNLGEVLPILCQVATALDYAHGEKVIHRDIKPENVVLRADGTVKVLDFGLAAQIHTSLSRLSQVKHGTSGTAPYMAPEQWRGQFQDAATDQYSFAVMTYELLAGHLPFETPDPLVLREAVLRENPRCPEGVASAVWEALGRGLAKQREHRFRSCAEFASALAGKEKAQGEPPGSQTAVLEGQARDSGLRRGLIAAGAMTLLLPFAWAVWRFGAPQSAETWSGGQAAATNLPVQTALASVIKPPSRTSSVFQASTLTRDPEPLVNLSNTPHLSNFTSLPGTDRDVSNLLAAVVETQSSNAVAATPPSESKPKNVQPLNLGPAVVTQNANIRGQPDNNSEVVARMTKGQSITVLEVMLRTNSEDSSVWTKIALPPATRCWVIGDFIDPDTKVVRSPRLNLRSGPGENFSVLGQLNRGDTVKVFRSIEAWLEIEAPADAYAFIPAHLLTQ